nr:uncharacterized protein LOC116154123 [Camelus dromedarius]
MAVTPTRRDIVELDGKGTLAGDRGKSAREPEAWEWAEVGLQGRKPGGFTGSSPGCVCVCVCVRAQESSQQAAGSGFPVCVAPSAWTRVRVPEQHVQGEGACVGRQCECRERVRVWCGCGCGAALVGCGSGCRRVQGEAGGAGAAAAAALTAAPRSPRVGVRRAPGGDGRADLALRSPPGAAQPGPRLGAASRWVVAAPAPVVAAVPRAGAGGRRRPSAQSAAPSPSVAAMATTVTCTRFTDGVPALRGYWQGGFLCGPTLCQALHRP